MFRRWLLALLAVCSAPVWARAVLAGDWAPAEGRLFTPFAEGLTPENAHREHPRPQLARPRWESLNGLWDYAITRQEGDGPGGAAAKSTAPAKWDGKILVPFPVESALSGVKRPVAPDEQLVYRRAARILKPKGGGRWLLHFGAVDYHARVFVNGRLVGEHSGGFTPFTCDITDALGGPETRDGDETQEIVLVVRDPTDRGTQPRGKQALRPEGIWYTAVTGVWQSVWLEPVPAEHLTDLKIVPDLAGGRVRVTAAGSRERLGVKLSVSTAGQVVARAEGRCGEAIDVVIPKPRAWSPDDPFLYDLSVEVAGGDRVTSYFGMRSIALGPDENGVTRMLLNGKPLFQFGPLDQGWWPDGLYTAPSDAALKYDVEMTRKLGFNMARKHVKVEPDRWYYWCDKLGLLVWQDMPSGDAYIAPGAPDIQRSEASAATFHRELDEMIGSLENHPSIVMWVPFNEGWGQFDTARVTEIIRARDPSRLVDCASGWNDHPGVGDVHDIHVYPGPAAPNPEPRRAAVLGEFGGLGLPLAKHTWQDEKNWGYRSFTSREELTSAYEALIFQLRPLIGRPGLSAAVYTQTTDVEIEVNGLLTYDRKLVKPDLERVVAANRKLFLPPPVVTTLVPTARTEALTWRYTTSKPGDGWEKPAFDDGAWKQGPGGLGTEGTPGAAVRTEWNTPDIWARRTFTLDAPADAGEVMLLAHHDEDAELYLNGVLAARVSGYTVDYTLVPISPAARKALKKGRNTISLHCHQTGGGQYIDAGIVAVREQDAAKTPTR